MIIARFDAILDQSERVRLVNHQSNDTDIKYDLNRQGKYFIARDSSLKKKRERGAEKNQIVLMICESDFFS